jgi:hypothetical protein
LPSFDALRPEGDPDLPSLLTNGIGVEDKGYLALTSLGPTKEMPTEAALMPAIAGGAALTPSHGAL